LAVRELFDQAGRAKRKVLTPGNYPAVACVFADLSGFSGYVRDTQDHRTIEDCLTAFCSRSRYQIINDGGMLYQFLGDAVIGLFGIPAIAPDTSTIAFECARALLSVAASISNEWQRQLDRVQPASGCHIGIALGTIQILSLRPFSRTHIGVVSDAINNGRQALLCCQARSNRPQQPAPSRTERRCKGYAPGGSSCGSQERGNNQGVGIRKPALTSAETSKA
jgi:class 3 adenylate cyclase